MPFRLPRALWGAAAVFGWDDRHMTAEVAFVGG